MRFSTTTGLVWRGVLAILIGIVALAWPSITIGAFVLLFAVYAFLGAGVELVLMTASRTAGPVIGHLLLALINIAAGVVAIAWPGVTALVLVIVVAVWALIAGIAEAALAFGHGETAGQRAMLALTGLISIAFGVVLVFRPDVGAVVIAQVFGLFSMVSGIAALVVATNVHTHGQPDTSGQPDPSPPTQANANPPTHAQ